jgi:hypothetical protein
MHYGIDAAPAFVLLDAAGRATARTGPVAAAPGSSGAGGDGGEEAGRAGGGGGGGGDGLAGREALMLSLDAVIESGRR